MAAVREFPEDAFDDELVPGFMTFRRLARHILESSHILTALVLDGEDDFHSPAFRAKWPLYLPVLAEDATIEQLASALEAKLEEDLARVGAQPAEFWQRSVKHFTGALLPMRELLSSFRQHEAEHRAQIALLLRIKGIVPHTTRRRVASQPAPAAKL